jgi:uncharacterized SAM-binding protein YcdF (DUF218 family)
MQAIRTALVVPGHGGLGPDRVHRISRRCLRVVTEAERLAEALEPAAVVLSGWSPSGGLSEAEQMREAWRGPHVELVVEPTARNTAQNASRTLPLLLERGIAAAVVVCAPFHLLRTRLFFGPLYGMHGVAVRYSVAHVRWPLGALAWELGALPFAPLQLLAARSEVGRRTRG